MPKNLFGYTLPALTEEMVSLGESKYRSKQLFSWIYQKRVFDFDAMTDIVRGECYVMPVAPLVGELETVMPENAPILKMIGVGTVESTTALMKRLAPVFPRCDFYKSQHYIMEAVAKGVNKASGLDVLCAHCGIDVSETIAFGDSYNDIRMIQTAGMGVAMDNAEEALKEAADYVTADCDHDGIVAALRHFNII